MDLIITLYITLGFALLVLLIVRAGLMSFGLRKYMLSKCPEKADEIGISSQGFYSGVKFFDFLFSGDKFDDDELVNKKIKQASFAIKQIIITMVALPLGLMLLMFVVTFIVN